MAGKSLRGEFDLIAALYAPLAGEGAFGLANDGAVTAPPPGEELVVTLDTMVDGVHYLPDDPPELVARKLLRVNLSDLAAMGAEPSGYLLSTALSPAIDDAWMERFAAGLAADQRAYGFSLLGGDTVRTPGPTTLSCTAFGYLPKGTALVRSGARPGDLLCLSGTLGDAALGLLVRRGGLLDLEPAERAFLEDAYRLPRPRTALGPRLRGLASACLDVSDGLLGDLGHILDGSGCGAVVESHRLPLSPAAAAALADDLERLATVLTGGDDYELLFTVAAESEPALQAAAAAAATPVTVIGRIVEGRSLTVVDRDGHPLDLAATGWRHF